MTLLLNGKVLIAGGMDNSGTILSSAELYDPSSQTFTATSSMSDSRIAHAAILLGNGEVLIAGGADNSGSVVATGSKSSPTASAYPQSPASRWYRFSMGRSLLFAAFGANFVSRKLLKAVRRDFLRADIVRYWWRS